MNSFTRSGALLLCLVLGTAAPGSARSAGVENVFHDEFLHRLGEGWSFEREDRAHWRTGPSGLEVWVQPGNMWGGANNARNVLVRPVPSPISGPVEISVTVSNQPTAQWEQANLVWYYDASNMVKLGQELVTGRLSIVMGREQDDRARTVAIIPLDAHTVELRLQAVENRVRGQFRTAPWRDWRDVGECDLPVKGEPKASLHFYNGPPSEEHWVRVNQFTVRRLPPSALGWPSAGAEEKVVRAADNPRPRSAGMPLPGGFELFLDAEPLHAEAAAVFEQGLFRNRDGTYGWRWDRRTSASRLPVLAGVRLGSAPPELATTGSRFRSLRIDSIRSLELDMDAVTRLEDDRGDHTLVAVLEFKLGGRVRVAFDWYGPASDVQTLHDGFREYGRVEEESATGGFHYRIRGFRGAPPRVNLKAFLDDAVKRGLAASSEVASVWFGNEIWNGSRGGTLVTRLDLIVDGRRDASVPAR